MHMKGQIWKTLLSLRGSSLRTLDEFGRIQWLGGEKTAALHEERLAGLLTHAYTHVPYYRGVLSRTGVIHNGLARLDKFSGLPLLDKSLIRRYHAELTSDDLLQRKWYENTSGGSTGEPVRFVQDREYHDASSAIKILLDRWSGYEIGERKVILWGSERDLFIGKETLQKRTGRWLRSEQWINAFRITPGQMLSAVKCINDFRPVQILAYSGSIYDLALFIEKEKLDVCSPRSIMASAGVLYPYMRDAITRVFRAPVFDRYGSREVGDIACECEHHQGLHVFPCTHHVEILRQDGSPCDTGEPGEIVITNLTNYAMPLIRYRIGDMGEWAANACACGRAWPMLKQIIGRVSDMFMTTTGTKIHGEYFTHLFYFRDWVDKFQIIQEKLDLLRVLIVPRQEAHINQEERNGEFREITEKIVFVMGRDCRVRFDLVNHIDPTASGKYRYTVSKVSKEDA